MSVKIKYAIYLSAALLGLLIYGIFTNTDHRLKVYFLDVGQGDAILIRTPENQDILIDGGPNSNVVNKLGDKLPFYDRKIELMVLTHPHADHITGLNEILKRYKVDKIITGGLPDYNGAEYEWWKNELRLKSIPVETMLAGQEIVFGQGVGMKILYPLSSNEGKKFEDLNAGSLVTRLSYYNASFLFTGDAPLAVEDSLLAKKTDLRSTVLKVGHHGSKYSSGPDFLKTVGAEFSVIQSGAGNSFGHPHFKTLHGLEDSESLILRNDQCGTISFFTNGDDLTVKSDRCQTVNANIGGKAPVKTTEE